MAALSPPTPPPTTRTRRTLLIADRSVRSTTLFCPLRGLAQQIKHRLLARILGDDLLAYGDELLHQRIVLGLGQLDDLTAGALPAGAAVVHVIDGELIDVGARLLARLDDNLLQVRRQSIKPGFADHRHGRYQAMVGLSEIFGCVGIF